MLACTFLALVLLPFVSAQQLSEVDLAAIRAHFIQSHIVPDFLPSFEPEATLDVNFNGVGSISPGQQFSKGQVAQSPRLALKSRAPLDGQYTLAMMDADVTGTNLSTGTNRHWLLYNVTVDQNLTVSNATATTITPYAGPGPAPGSGSHRYVIAVYEQPVDFAPPAEFQTNQGVARMDWNGFVTDSHLGKLVAANYIQVEEGTASAAIISTAPVITSTLAPASTVAPSAASTSASATGRENSASGLSTYAFGAHVSVAIALAAFITFLV